MVQPTARVRPIGSSRVTTGMSPKLPASQLTFPSAVSRTPLACMPFITGELVKSDSQPTSSSLSSAPGLAGLRLDEDVAVFGWQYFRTRSHSGVCRRGCKRLRRRRGGPGGLLVGKFGSVGEIQDW